MLMPPDITKGRQWICLVFSSLNHTHSPLRNRNFIGAVSWDMTLMSSNSSLPYSKRNMLSISPAYFRVSPAFTAFFSSSTPGGEWMSERILSHDGTNFLLISILLLKRTCS